MRQWEIRQCDLGWGPHPVVLVSHSGRVEQKRLVEVLDCSSQRATRPPLDHEVLLDEADGLDWPTLCKCDCIYAVDREELKEHRGDVVAERRRKIVRAIIQSHGWSSL